MDCRVWETIATEYVNSKANYLINEQIVIKFNKKMSWTK